MTIRRHRLRARAGRLRRRVRAAIRRGPELSILVTGPPPGGASSRRVEYVTELAAARGDYVTVLHPGDTLAPEFATAVLDVARPDRVVFAIVTADAGEPVPTRKADRAGLTEALRTLRGAVLPVGVVRAAGPLPTSPGSGETIWLAEAITAHQLQPVMADVRCLTTASDVTASAVDTAHALDVLDHLDALPRDHPKPVVAAAIGVATAPLNRAVRENPELRATVLQRVAGIADFDYSQLNRDVARDLAVLYAALPLTDTSANIAARRVREFGAVVDVVSADLRRKRSTDPSAELLWQDLIDTHVRLGGRGTVQGDWPAIGRFVTEGLAFVATQEAHKGAYRSVYSRTMFPASHLLAAAYKLDHPDTPWLAEFSDPQLINPYGERRRSSGDPDPALTALLDRLVTALRERGVAPPSEPNVWEWTETATYALADTIMFTNEHQRDHVLGYCADAVAAERARDRSLVSHHPSPPADLYTAADPEYPLDPGLVHLGYFGTFYPTRTLTEVVDAIGGLDQDDRSRLRLHVFTNKPDALRDDVAAAGLSDVVVVGPYLPFTSYLALTTRLDVLLVNDYLTSSDVNPYLPAKYADYVGSGTPIWGVVEPGSVLSAMPLAHRSDLGDVAGAVRVLTGLAKSLL